jgi:hypothetical protein
MSYEIYKEEGTLDGQKCERHGGMDLADGETFIFEDGSCITIRRHEPKGWEYEGDAPLAWNPKADVGFEPTFRLMEAWGGGGLRFVETEKKNEAGEWVPLEPEERAQVLRERYREDYYREAEACGEFGTRSPAEGAAQAVGLFIRMHARRMIAQG